MPKALPQSSLPQNSVKIFSFAAIRTIQLKIALFAGLCLTGDGVILIIYSLFSCQSIHHYITTKVMQLVDRQTKQSLLNRASTEALAIKAELDVGFDAARTMAHAFAVLADEKTAAHRTALDAASMGAQRSRWQ
jgi:methyl-accepting chemotaxis protein